VEIAIIGAGSIGKRHKRVLENLGHRALFVSQHQKKSRDVYADVETLLSKNSPEYFIIANETFRHEETIATLIQSSFGGLVLVEKPLAADLDLESYSKFKACYVGFNLRFNPMVMKLKQLIDTQKLEILNVVFHYGNSTKNWRSSSDAHQSYSRSKSCGGGVLRDFCHEIDLAQWLFGFTNVEYSFGSKIDDFMLDGEDLVNIVLGGNKKFKAIIHLNSLETIPKRTLTVHTSKMTYTLDFLKSELTYGENIEIFDLNSDYTYQEMHRAIISGDSSLLASVRDGLTVDRIIRDTESAYS
jgi:predicted dehydrogenase